jgi:hypothetical protein
MSSIDIHATITKPIDELENDIFFSLDKDQLKDFICSLDEKSGSVDFTLQLIKRLVGGLIDFYKRYITDTDCDKGLAYHNEYVEQYKKLDAILNILNDIR